MIINLTQHQATPEQTAAGVIDLPAELRAELQKLLTFEELPSREVLFERAIAIMRIAKTLAVGAMSADPQADVRAMIGGAPYFMGQLERSLINEGITPIYAFSRRESVEEVQADGSVRKVNVFRHIGFVEP